jgi:starch-binding outer membrane protein, SusD/RagB family
MKRIHYILLICGVALASFKKTIDLYPLSNINSGTYYSNYDEVRTALNGVYNGMQRPLANEWQFTELRSDNAKQGSPGSTASTNRDLSDLDMFTPATAHAANYNYWLATYASIRNCNTILQKLGVIYNPASGTISLEAINIPISDADRKQTAGEAMVIRAYHYFNLVRLYGGVFLVHAPIAPEAAKQMNRSTAADIYKLIEADLLAASDYLKALKYTQYPVGNNPELGRATRWAAKGLLAKVYLTQNKKAEAITLLQDVITNSGNSLTPVYANIFNPGSEANNPEILFAVRYKAGGLGLGSPFGNTFGPLGTGSAVINGDGDGLNYPTSDLDTLTMGDPRRPTLIAIWQPGPGQALYVKKFLFPVTQVDDGESDWPVLRYADILLMMAEAQGYTQTSLDRINEVRTRVGLPNYTMATITSVAQFEKVLSDERRVEFAFENQRWFDLVRFNSTLTTINAVQAMKDHFTDEFFTHYRLYVAPAPTLIDLHTWITNDKLLLPIPQREIDTNTQLVIPQNPGY